MEPDSHGPQEVVYTCALAGMQTVVSLLVNEAYILLGGCWR